MEKLNGLLDRAVGLKRIANEVCRDGLLMVVIDEVTRYYRFLIPNERNKREAAAFQDWLENAPIINEASQSNDEFALFFVFKEELDKESPSSAELLEFLKKHTIILKRGDEEKSFTQYYKPFSRNGDCFRRCHSLFKRSEQGEPYMKSFRDYLKGLLFRENFDYKRIGFEYGFQLDIDVLYPIDEYKEQVQQAVKDPFLARELFLTLQERVMAEIDGLYFQDLCRGVSSVKCCIPPESIGEYGFSSLELFKEYDGENRKLYQGRELFGYKYEMAERISLIATKKDLHLHTLCCRVHCKPLLGLELVERLYEKEVMEGIG